MQKLFTDMQALPTAACLPKPGSAEYDWWLSERGLLNVASGEDVQVIQVAKHIAQPPAPQASCPRDHGGAACEGCKCV